MQSDEQDRQSFTETSAHEQRDLMPAEEETMLLTQPRKQWLLFIFLEKIKVW